MIESRFSFGNPGLSLGKSFFSEIRSLAFIDQSFGLVESVNRVVLSGTGNPFLLKRDESSNSLLNYLKENLLSLGTANKKADFL